MDELSENDKQLVNNIEIYGWHVIKVMEDEIGPGFGYSIGLFKTFGHPEIIIIGLELDLIHLLINNIGEDIRNGKTFQAGQYYPGIIESVNCFFTSVDKKHYAEYVSYAQWYYKDVEFPLLQCVYPIVKTIYPWQSDWPKEIKNQQPILGDINNSGQ